jgi:hypothetical protein
VALSVHGLETLHNEELLGGNGKPAGTDRQDYTHVDELLPVGESKMIMFIRTILA